MQVDLHIHTTASDGTWTPAQLVEKAAALKLGAIAVTDHDTVANVAETSRLAKAAGIKLVPGAEVCATKGDLQLHILAYGINIYHKPLLELMAHNKYLLDKKDLDSIMLLARDGWPVTMEEFLAYKYDKTRGGWKALAYLIDKGLCTGVEDFFSRIFTSEHDLDLPQFTSVREVISTIHSAGGVALCAHAASDFHGPGFEEVLEDIGNEPLDGFECYHSGHSAEDTAKLLQYCRSRGLMISGGSDCHGTFVKTRHLGQPYVEAEDLYLPGLL